MSKYKRIMNKLIAAILIVAIGFSCCILPAQKVVYADSDNEEKAHAGLLERAVSALFTTAALGVYAMISVVAGEAITIEDLIFNQYSKTRLTFFEKNPLANPNTYLTQGRSWKYN